MTDLWKLSALDMRAGLDAKDFSAVEIMTSVVGRMQATNPALNAVVYDYSEQALAWPRQRKPTRRSPAESTRGRCTAFQ